MLRTQVQSAAMQRTAMPRSVFGVRLTAGKLSAQALPAAPVRSGLVVKCQGPAVSSTAPFTMPLWLKRGLAAAALVPLVTLGVFGQPEAHARRKPAPAPEPVATVAPTTTAESSTTAPAIKPEVAFGAAMALLLVFFVIKAGSGASTPAGPTVTEEQAKDIANTAILLEYYRPVADGNEDPVARLDEQTGGAFSRVAEQHNKLVGNKRLLKQHAGLQKLVGTVSDLARANPEPVWSVMYDKQTLLKEAETGMPDFLEAIKRPYPDLHAVLAAATADNAVAVLVTLGAWQQRSRERKDAGRR